MIKLLYVILCRKLKLFAKKYAVLCNKGAEWNIVVKLLLLFKDFK